MVTFKSKCPPSNYRAGIAAENIAAMWLRLKGYRILARRFKTPVGEIDMVAKRGRNLAFVEVKRRPCEAAALAAISPENAQRVRRAAEWWLKSRPDFADKCDIRFDVVALGAYCRIRHLPNVF